jgi:hypothetical protein
MEPGKCAQDLASRCWTGECFSWEPFLNAHVQRHTCILSLALSDSSETTRGCEGRLGSELSSEVGRGQDDSRYPNRRRPQPQKDSGVMEDVAENGNRKSRSDCNIFLPA